MENSRVVNISVHGGGEGGGMTLLVCLFVWGVGVSFKLWRVSALSPSSLHSCSRVLLFWEAQADVILLGFPRA